LDCKEISDVTSGDLCKSCWSEHKKSRILKYHRVAAASAPAAPSQPPSTRIPPELVTEILAGNCVAFVGAGFSRESDLPSWAELLHNVFEEHKRDIAEPQRDHLTQIIRKITDGVATSDVYEQAAQMLKDSLGSQMSASIAKQLAPDGWQLRPAMRDRLRYLDGIPFRAILTTNFDELLDGTTPFDSMLKHRDAPMYASVLRPSVSES
jgi:hypothetical protein